MLHDKRQIADTICPGDLGEASVTQTLHRGICRIRAEGVGAELEQGEGGHEDDDRVEQERVHKGAVEAV